eukprot:jgi/Mesvir1/12567/Mv07840-RA.1
MSRHQAPSKKLFFIGLNKSGTKVLDQLTLLLGLHSCHDVFWARASRRLNASYFEQEAPKCQAFCDGEQPAFDWLDKTFPGSAFVMNTRPLESWLVSRQAAYRRLVATRFSTVPEQELRLEYRTRAPDVHYWMTMREAYHARVLRYFSSHLLLNVSTSYEAMPVPAVAQPGPLMAPTGTIYRCSHPGESSRPTSFFMMVDLITDGEARVREQLQELLRESGLDKVARTATNSVGPVGVIGPQYAENTRRAKACVSGVLDSISLTAGERASDLLVGRPLPPLPRAYDGSNCPYLAVI